ncbi:MAG: DoxX family membrane protein [Melioribacteraceae bacterium]|nr:DoxX family membrane protein [Melioribacteraceae bacterium]
MNKILSDRYFLLCIRIVVGFVFIFAGIEKISSPEHFAVSIENYRVFPDFTINIIAIYIPWLELLTGILLIFGIAVKENASIVSALLAIFILLVFSAVVRGLDIECGCFGTSDGQKVGLLKIAENLFLFVAGIIIYLRDHNPISLASK